MIISLISDFSSSWISVWWPCLIGRRDVRGKKSRSSQQLSLLRKAFVEAIHDIIDDKLEPFSFCLHFLLSFTRLLSVTYHYMDFPVKLTYPSIQFKIYLFEKQNVLYLNLNLINLFSTFHSFSQIENKKLFSINKSPWISE